MTANHEESARQWRQQALAARDARDAANLRATKALQHLQAILSHDRTCEQMLAAERAAREFLADCGL